MQYINFNFMIMVAKDFYSMLYQEFDQQNLSILKQVRCSHFPYKLRKSIAFLLRKIPSWSTSTKMAALMAVFKLQHPFWAYLKLPFMVYHADFVEIKKLLWFFGYSSSKLTTFGRFYPYFNTTPNFSLDYWSYISKPNLT